MNCLRLVLVRELMTIETMSKLEQEREREQTRSSMRKQLELGLEQRRSSIEPKRTKTLA